MSLYKLTGQALELMQMMEDDSVDQETIQDTLEGIEFEIEEKADSYAKIIRMLEGNIDLINSEIERLNKKKTSIENNIKSLKSNLENTMRLLNKQKFKTELFSFNIQANPATVVIDDEAAIPQSFLIPQSPKVDKKAIKEVLKYSKLPYAHLENTEGLRIR